MVAPVCAATPPTLRVMGIAVPEAAVAGTVAVICSTPAIGPGASSAVAIAVIPPMVTTTDATGLGSAFEPVRVPSAPAGLVTPSPVAKDVTEKRE
jgi:hypothetical protein